MTRRPDGGLTWTSPSGHTITTYPLRYGADDDLPPPAPAAKPKPAAKPTKAPLTMLEQLRRWPPPPPDPDDEPAPF